jgi:hypothetical protein
MMAIEFKSRLIFVALVLQCLGCGPSGFTRVESIKPVPSIRTIAVDFRSGGIGEHLEKILMDNGFRIIKKEETYKILRDLDLVAIDASLPEQLTRLKNKEIDAYLTLRTVFAEMLGRPLEVYLNLYSTYTGQAVISLDWKNGWGGQPGSPADHSSKKTISESAEAVASRLISELRRGE